MPVQIPATQTVTDVGLCSLRIRLPNGVEVSGLGPKTAARFAARDRFVMIPRTLRPSTELKRVFLYRWPVEFRKSYRGLSVLIELGHNPFSGDL